MFLILHSLSEAETQPHLQPAAVAVFRKGPDPAGYRVIRPKERRSDIPVDGSRVDVIEQVASRDRERQVVTVIRRAATSALTATATHSAHSCRHRARHHHPTSMPAAIRPWLEEANGIGTGIALTLSANQIL
jgi:hypothetical protein